MAGGQLQGVIKCQENHFHISGNVDIIASRSGILNQKSYSKTSMVRFLLKTLLDVWCFQQYVFETWFKVSHLNFSFNLYFYNFSF